MFAKHCQGYPLFYINKINECLCLDCAKENHDDYAKYQDDYNHKRLPETEHINWEK